MCGQNFRLSSFSAKISDCYLFFNLSDCHFFLCKISDCHFFSRQNFRLLCFLSTKFQTAIFSRLNFRLSLLSSMLFLQGYTILQLFFSILVQSLSPGAGIEDLFLIICRMTTRTFILVKKETLLAFLPN